MKENLFKQPNRVALLFKPFCRVTPAAGDRPPNPDYGHWLRFFFGPPEHNLRLGLARLIRMLTESG